MNKTNNISWVTSTALPVLNTSETMTPVSPMLQEDSPEMKAMICQQAITIFLTLFGNLLMIFVILRNNYILRRKRITPVQILMLNLCTSDLLFALMTILPTLIMTLTAPNFYGPDLLCKLVKFLQVLEWGLSATKLRGCLGASHVYELFSSCGHLGRSFLRHLQATGQYKIRQIQSSSSLRSYSLDNVLFYVHATAGYLREE